MSAVLRFILNKCAVMDGHYNSNPPSLRICTMLTHCEPATALVRHCQLDSTLVPACSVNGTGMGYINRWMDRRVARHNQPPEG